MTRASWPAAIASFAFAALCLGGVIFFLMMWDASVVRSYNPQSRTVEIRDRTFGEVWHYWHSEARVPIADVVVLLIVALLPVVASFVAWLLLPTVHRDGSAWRSYGLTFRAVSAGAGLLVVLTLVLGAAIVTEINEEERGDSTYGDVAIPGTMLVLAASLGLLVSWVTRAAKSLADPSRPIELPPRCEGCGYDLTHRPVSGLCPECGLPVESSLEGNRRRRGCSWEANPRGVWSWVSTSLTALLSPSRFYGTLKLRTPPEPAERFSRRHYAVIAVGAVAWMFGVIAGHIRREPSICWLPFIIMFLVLIAAWGVQRLIGAAATSWWIVKGTLPDVTWARKVIAYESAYLWAFCLFNGAWIASLILDETWLSKLFASVGTGRFLLLGMPLEELVMIVANAVMLLAWFLRYRIAARSIRWSNY